jgi:hypothetical protein
LTPFELLIAFSLSFRLPTRHRFPVACADVSILVYEERPEADLFNSKLFCYIEHVFYILTRKEEAAMVSLLIFCSMKADNMRVSYARTTNRRT